MTSPALFYSF